MSTLRGNLRSISLMDVVQLLNVNRKTGKLIVTQEKTSGILYVLNGDVVHAETP
jgi:pyruvate/2-oxoglutarate/acetoin dehydrogenase E1 component